MAKNRRLTAEDLAAQEERAQQFKALLRRRRERDEELKATREKRGDRP